MDTLPQEVIDLIVAARRVCYEQEDAELLDDLLEPFAQIVPWDDEPAQVPA